MCKFMPRLMCIRGIVAGARTCTESLTEKWADDIKVLSGMGFSNEHGQVAELLEYENGQLQVSEASALFGALFKPGSESVSVLCCAFL